MNCDKIVNGKEIQTKIEQFVLENSDFYCEAGTNGNEAYIRFSPDCHKCTVIELTDKDSTYMMVHALEKTARVLREQIEEMEKGAI